MIKAIARQATLWALITSAALHLLLLGGFLWFGNSYFSNGEPVANSGHVNYKVDLVFLSDPPEKNQDRNKDTAVDDHKTILAGRTKAISQTASEAREEIYRQTSEDQTKADDQTKAQAALATEKPSEMILEKKKPPPNVDTRKTADVSLRSGENKVHDRAKAATTPKNNSKNKQAKRLPTRTSAPVKYKSAKSAKPSKPTVIKPKVIRTDNKRKRKNNPPVTHRQLTKMFSGIADDRASTNNNSQELKRIKQGYVTLVLSHLNRYKRYPAGARKRGMIGTVGLRFTINRTGGLLKASVVKSSGHKELDREVIAMTKRAGRFPAIPKALTARSLTFKVSIRFELPSNSTTRH